MKKTILVLLSIITLANFIFLTIAFTNDYPALTKYKFLIGICFITFGGFLRKHILSYNKKRVSEN
ncbi:hypothetical protein RCH33_1426 [Flavobacterium daejeonense]|nr:hypothetical protein RCH33_1426 [Flavobacterium daejeonense]